MGYSKPRWLRFRFFSHLKRVSYLQGNAKFPVVKRKVEAIGRSRWEVGRGGKEETRPAKTIFCYSNRFGFLLFFMLIFIFLFFIFTLIRNASLPFKFINNRKCFNVTKVVGRVKTKFSCCTMWIEAIGRKSSIDTVT